MADGIYIIYSTVIDLLIFYHYGSPCDEKLYQWFALGMLPFMTKARSKHSAAPFIRNHNIIWLPWGTIQIVYFYISLSINTILACYWLKDHLGEIRQNHCIQSRLLFVHGVLLVISETVVCSMGNFTWCSRDEEDWAECLNQGIIRPACQAQFWKLLSKKLTVK